MTAITIDAGDDLPLTIPRLIRQRAKERGDNPLLVTDDATLSYRAADERSRLVARGLLAAGAGKGSHVAVLHPNTPDFVVGVLAAARIGAVIVPFSTFSTADELRWLLANSDTGYLLAAPGHRSHDFVRLLQTAIPELDLSRPPPLRSPAAPALRRIWFSGTAQERRNTGWSLADLEAGAAAVDETFLEAVEARVTPADRFVIVHTSGSTSSPKGVMHIQGGLIRHIDNLNQIRRYTPDEILFSNSAFFWIGGFAYTFLGTIVAGGCLVTSNAAAASDVLDLIERTRPTMTNGYLQPSIRLAADPSFPGRDVSSMRRGNLYPIMPPEVRPRDPELRHGNYGMTEAGSSLTTHPDEGDIPEHQRGSFGTFAPGFEGKIVDPDTGKECGPGEIGELWLRGPFLMEGYYGKARSQVFDAEGWWHSGDLGAVDAERLFYFKGRRGDMIKTAGANVSPKEVEAVLQGLINDRQCLVIGVPDPERGQIVAALVVAETDAEVDEAGLKQQLAAKLSSYKVPKRILRFGQAELPMMSSGKIDMRILNQLVQKRL
jgi:acyl-CoA synthetase (AMP-forming)/AMP-acid ligase II